MAGYLRNYVPYFAQISEALQKRKVDLLKPAPKGSQARKNFAAKTSLGTSTDAEQRSFLRLQSQLSSPTFRACGLRDRIPYAIWSVIVGFKLSKRSKYSQRPSSWCIWRKRGGAVLNAFYTGREDVRVSKLKGRRQRWTEIYQLILGIVDRAVVPGQWKSGLSLLPTESGLVDRGKLVQPERLCGQLRSKIVFSTIGPETKNALSKISDVCFQLSALRPLWKLSVCPICEPRGGRYLCTILPCSTQ